MATLLGTIIEGITLIIGAEVLVFILFTFSFMAFLISRGLGISALISTFVLSAYLLSSETINNNLFLPFDYFILIIMFLGMFLGLLVYNYFVRN